METEIFSKKHSEILKPYDIGIEWNCDLVSIATGINYWTKQEGDGEDEWNKPLFGLTGIRLRDGFIEGDVEGYLKLLKEILEEKVSNSELSVITTP